MTQFFQFSVFVSASQLHKLNKFALLTLCEFQWIIQLLHQFHCFEDVIHKSLIKSLPNLIIINLLNFDSWNEWIQMSISGAYFIEWLIELNNFWAIDFDLKDHLFKKFQFSFYIILWQDNKVGIDLFDVILYLIEVLIEIDEHCLEFKFIIVNN